MCCFRPCGDGLKIQSIIIPIYPMGIVRGDGEVKGTNYAEKHHWKRNENFKQSLYQLVWLAWYSKSQPPFQEEA